MSCRTEPGISLTLRVCDVDRTGSHSEGEITAADRAPCSLPGGRYMHTKTLPDGAVSITHGVNSRWASDKSIAQLFFPATDGAVCRVANPVTPQKPTSNGFSAGRAAEGEAWEDNGGRAISPPRAKRMQKDADAIAFAYRNYRMARLASVGIDVAEVHDSLTVTHPIGYEEVDFAETSTNPEGPVADGK